MREEEENRRLKPKNKERRCVLLWRGEAAQQKAPCIILHKLSKQHTLFTKTHWRILKEQFVGQLGAMETH